MAKTDFEILSITAEDGVSQFSLVPELGGKGISLILPYKGESRELLYLPDGYWELEDKAWKGGWPFCFPVCGRSTCKTLPMHGFAAHKDWQVIDKHADKITLQLSDTPETRKIYPYAFRLTLAYEIKPGQLTCLQTCENLSDEAMPYYAGFHPYFLTPLTDKDKIHVDFKAIGRKQYNLELTDIIGDLLPLKLPQKITDPALNEQLSLVNENKTALIYPDQMKVSMEVRGLERENMFPYVQMYTQPDKSFFCIEPWMNFPNALNHKDKTFNLPPNSQEQALLTLKIC
jgi:galactose mutarotase-like enzyme